MRITNSVSRSAKFFCWKCWALRMLTIPASIADALVVLFTVGFYNGGFTCDVSENILRHALTHRAKK